MLSKLFLGLNDRKISHSMHGMIEERGHGSHVVDMEDWSEQFALLAVDVACTIPHP